MSKEFKCTYCKSTVKWAKEYVKGQGPLNLDGSKHNCKKTTTGGAKGTTYRIEEAAKEMDGTLGDGSVRFEPEPELIDTTEPLYPEPKTDRITVTCPFNDHKPCKISCALYLAGEINCCAFLLRVKK